MSLSYSSANKVADLAHTMQPTLLIHTDTAASSFHGDTDRRRNHQHPDHRHWQHLYVLPVLLLEFSALALTRAVLPSLLLQQFGNRVYLIMGCVDFVRGLFAFLASPLFGKISDVTGRRLCLLVTVLGTCAPVCSLAFFPWIPLMVADPEPTFSLENFSNHSFTSFLNHTRTLLALYTNNVSTAASEASSEGGGASDESSVWQVTNNLVELAAPEVLSPPYTQETVHPTAIIVFVVLLALSGIFSSTVRA